MNGTRTLLIIIVILLAIVNYLVYTSSSAKNKTAGAASISTHEGHDHEHGVEGTGKKSVIDLKQPIVADNNASEDSTKQAQSDSNGAGAATTPKVEDSASDSPEVARIKALLSDNPKAFEDLMRDRELVDVQETDASIQVSLRYSTTNNFVGKDMYGDLEKAFLQMEVADKLKKAQEFLKERKPKYSLLILDAARPLGIQKLLWAEVVGTPQRHYVANPARGSKHNYGAAVDLTIVNADGKELDMGTPYDFFGKLAHPKAETEMLQAGKLTKAQLANRQLLREVMVSAGFTGIGNEWWHFDGFSLKEAKKRYRIID